MRFGQLFTVFALLCGLSLAVLVEEAFKLEFFRYSFNPSNYQIFDGELIGTINQHQFGKVDLKNNNSMVWALDIDLLPVSVDDFAVTKSSVYLFHHSKDANLMVTVDKKSGIISDIVDLSSYVGSDKVINVVDYFNGGALVQTQNTIVFVDNGGQISQFLGTESFPQLDKIYMNQIDGKGILIANDRIYVLSMDLQVLSSTEFNEYPTSFNNGILFTKSKRVYIWNGENFDLVKADTSLVNGEAIDSAHVYTIGTNSVLLYSLTNNEFTLSHEIPYKLSSKVTLKNYGLSTYLIVSEEKLKHIYDLTDYLATNFPGSIKHIKTHAVGDDYITEKLTLITVNSDLNVKKTNLIDGTAIKGSIPPHFAFSTHSFLMELPASEETIEKVHHMLEDSHYDLIIIRWIHRVKRHLTELGKAVVGLIFGVKSDSKASFSKDFGFAKLLVFYNSASDSITGISTADGKLLWEVPVVDFKDVIKYNSNVLVTTGSQLILLDSRDGSVIHTVQENSPVIKLTGSDKCDGDDGVGPSRLAIQQGENYKLFDFNGIEVTEERYFVDKRSNTVFGNKFSPSSSLSSRTWSFTRQNEEIINVIGKSQNHPTASIGISLANKSVLYKYLNPNTITVVTKSSENWLNLYLIDGITGNVLFKESQANENIDFGSVNIIKDDNWIIYSYFVNSPKFEQRINVIDLFDSKKSIAKNDDLVSVFESNSTIDSFTKKSFIYPERIVSLSSTHSNVGITLKSIIAVTESGAMVEIPKYVLNSRRVDDRQITNEDMISDFRMSPYAPDIPQNNMAVLNHKYQLNTNDGVVLSRPTSFESTSVVCFVNEANCFCSTVQPSLSFDLLSVHFDRVKLLITIAILFAIYVATKPFVADQKLKVEWIDN
jgi:hypothetical protein